MGGSRRLQGLRAPAPWSPPSHRSPPDHPEPTHHKRRAGLVNVMTVDVRAAPSQSLRDIGIRAVAWQCSREDSMAKVAFLGLGVMGYPMAGHLKNKGGHDVTVYNRTAAKAQKWVGQYGGASAAPPHAAAPGPDHRLCCVAEPNQFRAAAPLPHGAFS